MNMVSQRICSRYILTAYHPYPATFVSSSAHHLIHARKQKTALMHCCVYVHALMAHSTIQDPHTSVYVRIRVCVYVRIRIPKMRPPHKTQGLHLVCTHRPPARAPDKPAFPVAISARARGAQGRQPGAPCSPRLHAVRPDRL